MPNTVTVDIQANTSEAESGVEGLGSSIKSHLGTASVAFGAVLGMANALSDIGIEFQEAERIIAAGTGASGANLEGLQDQFALVMKGVPDDAEDVATAVADLNTQLGLQGDELVEASTTMLNASRIMDFDLGKGIMNVSDLMVQFGIDNTKVTETMDKLVVAQQASGVPMARFLNQLVRGGADMQSFGFDMDETIALFAQFETWGIRGSKMVSALRMAQAELTKEGEDGTIPEIENMKEALFKMVIELERTEEGFQQVIKAEEDFGISGGPVMILAANLGFFAFQDLKTAIQETKGETARLTEHFTTGAEKTDTYTNKIKMLIAPYTEIFAILAPLIAGLTALTVAMAALTAISVMLGVSLLPIILIILAIGVVIAAIIVIWQNWGNWIEDFKLTWEAFWDDAEGPVMAIWDVLKSFFNFFIDGMNAVIRALNNFDISIPSWIPKFGGKSFGFNIAEIPHLAQGGIVTAPTLAMIGERGAEAVIPLNGSAGGMGGMNITIQGDIYGFDDFEDKVAEAVRDGARRGGYQGILRTA